MAIKYAIFRSMGWVAHVLHWAKGPSIKDYLILPYLINLNFLGKVLIASKSENQKIE